MNVHLMFRDKNFQYQEEPCFNQNILNTDLELSYILSAMSGKDKIILKSCTAALFHPLQCIDEIHYRQENLNDALNHPKLIRALYEITLETEKRRKSSWWWLSSSSSLGSNYSDAVHLLELYLESLEKLQILSSKALSHFHSDGFKTLFTMLEHELSPEYLSEIRLHLQELKADDGILISASLGNYLQGVSYVMRRKKRKNFWLHWHTAQSYTISPRDDAGATDLGRRWQRAINEPANALAQSADHLKSFFDLLRNELAFYVGCLNLADQIHALNLPLCIPDLLPVTDKKREITGIYDLSLALNSDNPITGNDLHTNRKMLYLITGTNQGGKSTFLRSIGQAQLMAQCGMFTAAGHFTAPVCRHVFTHFKKEEDSSMNSGKLDEELSRMDELVTHLEPGSLVLFNESFAATNEREGSELFRQITQALIDHDIEVFSVTHLYTYAVSFKDQPDVHYLRAEHNENGIRAHMILPGKPLKTAFGEEIYKEIFSDMEK